MFSKRKVCFLFGHRDTPEYIYAHLVDAIKKEIEKGAVYFYVGYRGSFDQMAIRALINAKQLYPHIVPMLLLSHHPALCPVSVPEGFAGSYYPPIDLTPPKYSIVKSNEYAIKMSDSIICYAHWIGNSRNLLQKATKGNIPITNLCISSEP